jgi:hypothetical protein
VKLSQHDLTITRKPHCSSRAMPSLDHAGSFTLSLGHFTQLTPHHSAAQKRPGSHALDRLPRRDRQLAQHTMHMAIDPAAASFLIYRDGPTDGRVAGPVGVTWGRVTLPAKVA